MKKYERIKQLFIVLWVIAAAATCCCHQAPLERGVTSIKEKKFAKISIENPVYDFGEIVQGEMPVATFIFRNTGEDVLNIDGVTADIKNITTVVSHTSIDCGEQGVVEVTLNSTGLRYNQKLCLRN